MITVEITGDQELISHLENMPDNIRKAVTKKVTTIRLKMEARVKQKLSGELLKVRSGDLLRSIGSETEQTSNGVYGRVFSTGGQGKNPVYAAIQENGGTTRPHIIMARKAKTLAFMMGGKMRFAKFVNHPGSVIKGVHYMSGTLKEFENEIINGMQDAVAEGIKAT